MENYEYKELQQNFSALMTEDLLKRKGFNSKEREIYIQAVLACKSVLSKRQLSSVEEIRRQINDL